MLRSAPTTNTTTLFIKNRLIRNTVFNVISYLTSAALQGQRIWNMTPTARLTRLCTDTVENRKLVCNWVTTVQSGQNTQAHTEMFRKKHTHTQCFTTNMKSCTATSSSDRLEWEFVGQQVDRSPPFGFSVSTKTLSVYVCVCVCANWNHPYVII